MSTVIEYGIRVDVAKGTADLKRVNNHLDDVGNKGEKGASRAGKA